MNCAVHTETPAVAYCRTCGKALCEDCKRDVMGAIYCEPCIAARLHGAAAPAPLSASMSGSPNPGLAALLGMIPGVGAMYNGQFLKAFLHALIFGLLCALSSYGTSAMDVLFGWMAGFFWFYMVFEAYKTARAKQLGLPTPDPLGLDRLFGLQETDSPATPSAAVPVSPAPAQPGPAPLDRTPTGAVILIALGVLFLLSNLGLLHIGRLWPLFLIAVGLWIAYKRAPHQA